MPLLLLLGEPLAIAQGSVVTLVLDLSGFIVAQQLGSPNCGQCGPVALWLKPLFLFLEDLSILVGIPDFDCTCNF